MLEEEQGPEHAEETYAGDGVVQSQRGEGDGAKGIEQAIGEQSVFAGDAPQPSSPFARREEIDGQQDGKDEHLVFPQLREPVDRVALDQGRVLPSVGAQDGQCRADGETDDHGPAGPPEPVGALQVGEGEEAGTERDGDAVVRVTAKDAHEEHQEIAIFEVLV